MADIEIKIQDNSGEVLKALAQALDGGLEECGLAWERFAKRYCPVDTGRLRNSLTHALGGRPAAISSYHGDKRDLKPEGTYSGTAPADGDGERSLWVGTNVEYAEKIELGSSKQAPQGYLLRAITGHREAYKRILEKWLNKNI